MGRISRIAVGAGLVALLAACQQQGGSEMPAQPVNLHEQMKNVVSVQAQVLWDISNRLLLTDGPATADLIPAADWDKMGVAAARMGEAARAIGNAKKLVVVQPGVKIDDEGDPGAWSGAQVQRAIDADPAQFKAHAQRLQESAATFTAAVKAHDAAKLSQVAGELDEVCEACHKQFWYPDEH